MPSWCAAATASASGIATSKNFVSERPELHGDEVNVAGLFDRVHSDDVGVIERGDGFRFPCEPRPAFFAFGELGRENLERDLPVELGVLGQKNLTHTTGADLLQDLVVSEGLTDHPWQF